MCLSFTGFFAQPVPNELDVFKILGSTSFCQGSHYLSVLMHRTYVLTDCLAEKSVGTTLIVWHDLGGVLWTV